MEKNAPYISRLAGLKRIKSLMGGDYVHRKHSEAEGHRGHNNSAGSQHKESGGGAAHFAWSLSHYFSHARPVNCHPKRHFVFPRFSALLENRCGIGTYSFPNCYEHSASSGGTKMKRSLIILCAGLILTGTALAQQNPPAQSGPNNNAVNSSGQKNSDAPVAGRNSFTEGQAKSKIEEAGYAGISDLKKDDNGVWRGKASKGGSSTNVSVDFQGNVNAAK
jgi:hypothetical protein